LGPSVDQSLQALGLPQVGRQDRRGERLPLVGAPAVTDARLLDIDGPDAGLDRSLGEVAVADNLPATGLILEVAVLIDPGGNLGLDGFSQATVGTRSEDVG
jgi:hypothetical protein